MQGGLGVKIVVLGAGVVGTAAAYWLARDGHEVTVVERHPGAGAGHELRQCRDWSRRATPRPGPRRRR